MATSARTPAARPVKSVSALKRLGRWLAAFDHGYLVLGILIGVLLGPFLRAISPEGIDNFLNNLVPEAFGMVFTILILNRMADARQAQSIRQQLIRRCHSRHNFTALAAVEELRIMGDLENGILAGLSLRGSNWQDCNLYRADLRGCDLTNVNFFRADLVLARLEGAKISDEQLASADIMHGAILPNGSRYDGRYNLTGDAAYATRSQVDPESPEEMAEWYGISLEQYLEGQSWAMEHLPKYRKRSTSYDIEDANNQIR
jgi:hypothetical protein